MDYPYILKPKVLLLKRKKKLGEEGNFLETMTRYEKRTSYDGEEIIKSMEHIFEDMTKNIMKGFKFLSIQSWEKYIDFKKTKEKNASACLKEQTKETREPPSSEIGEQNNYYMKMIEIHSQVTLKNMKRHHMSMKKFLLKILKIILRHMLPVAAFHTPGSHGRNIQATQCVLGGKSQVKAVTLFLTPPFRLNS